MENVYAHIVGMDNRDRKQFITDVKLLDYNVIDLNYITKIVRSNDYYKKIKDDYDNTKGKIEKRAIMRCMFNYWKKKIDDNISKIKNDNKLILLGLNSLDDNRLDIKTDNKFIVKHNLENSTKELVKENLDKYHNKIIEGGFSLDYIDKDFLMKKRQEVLEKYKKDKYKPIIYENLLKFLKGETVDKTNKSIGNVYYVSDEKFSKSINFGHKGGAKRDALDIMLDNDREIYAYKEKWLALLSHIPEHQKYFEKGFRNDKPYIKLLDKDSRKMLEKSAILYELNGKSFIRASDKNPYKLKSKSADIISDYEVKSIGDELKRCDVKIM